MSADEAASAATAKVQGPVVGNVESEGANVGATAAAAAAAAAAPPSRIDSQLETAAQHKDAGNRAYASGDTKSAMREWHFALLHSSGIDAMASRYGSKSTPEQTERAQSLTVAAQNNLASCYLNDGKWEKVVLATTKVLALDEKNIKAYYRRAKAQLRLGRVQKAADDLDKAMEVKPDDPGVVALAQELVVAEEKKLSEQRRKMGGFLKGRLLGGDGEVLAEISVTEKPEEGEGGDASGTAAPPPPPPGTIGHGHHHCGEVIEEGDEGEEDGAESAAAATNATTGSA